MEGRSSPNPQEERGSGQRKQDDQRMEGWLKAGKRQLAALRLPREKVMRQAWPWEGGRGEKEDACSRNIPGRRYMVGGKRRQRSQKEN